MTPLVSILIPAYNAEVWLADTLRSALAQTWAKKEIIVVVDDGCRDQTLAVARSFASKTISVVTRPHQTAAAARNEAYALCQGDYIQWLDADDLLGADKIARQAQLVEQGCSSRTLLSSEWAYFYYRPAKAKFQPGALWQDLTPQEWLIRKMSLGQHMQPATWLISREVAEAAGPWNSKVLIDEDGEYFCRVVLASNGIKFVPGAKVFYRASGSGSYTNRTLFQQQERWHGVQLQYQHLRSLGDSAEVRAASLAYLQTWLIFFYPESPAIVQEAERMAQSLGGQLTRPKLRWKYAWIPPLLGYAAAKRAQFVLPQFKARAVSFWDRTMNHLAKQRGV